MKLTCEDCIDSANCTKLCKKIKEEYEDLVEYEDQIENAYAKEKAISQLGNTENESSDAIQIDDLRSIDPGRVYDSVPDPEIDWDRTPPQPEASDIDGSEERLLKDGIAIATRRENLKLRRRFNNFLGCETIVDIAKRSRTSKQSIQKQFQRVIQKVHMMLLQNHTTNETAITPLKFKKKVYNIYSQ